MNRLANNPITTTTNHPPPPPSYQQHHATIETPKRAFVYSETKKKKMKDFDIPQNDAAAAAAAPPLVVGSTSSSSSSSSSLTTTRRAEGRNSNESRRTPSRAGRQCQPGGGGGRMRRWCHKFHWGIISWFHLRMEAILGPTTTLTLGQMILLSPLMIFTAANFYLTFVRPNTALSGMWAYYTILYVFVLSFKKATIFQWCVGLSWEQLVPIHHAASIVAILLSICHIYVSYTGHDYRPCREPITTSSSSILMGENNTNINNENGVHQQNHTSSTILQQQQHLPICRTLLQEEYLTPIQLHYGELPYHHHVLAELRLEDNPRFRYSMIGIEPSLWKFLWDIGRNVSGTWMFICLLVLLLSSFFRSILRRSCFDVWLLVHISASGALIAYSDKHRVQLFIVLILWWGLDGLIRYGYGTMYKLPKTATMALVTSSSTTTITTTTRQPYRGSIDEPLSTTPQRYNTKTKGVVADVAMMMIDPNAIVELTFPHKFAYTAGQYVRIAILETCQPIMFHPMTISSAPYQDQVTIHFRPFGGWTRQVARMAPTGGDDDDDDDVPSLHPANRSKQQLSFRQPNGDGRKVHVLLEGPYGGLSMMNLWDNPTQYTTVVLIAGGIGITPMTSIARQLLYEHYHLQWNTNHHHLNGQRKLKMVRVVWAVRDLGLVEALPLVPSQEELDGGDGVVEDDDHVLPFSSSIQRQHYQRTSSKRLVHRPNHGVLDPEGGMEPMDTFSKPSDPPLFAADIYLTTTTTTTTTKKDRKNHKTMTVQPRDGPYPIIIETEQEEGFEMHDPSSTRIIPSSPSSTRSLFHQQPPLAKRKSVPTTGGLGLPVDIELTKPGSPIRDERGYAIHMGRPNLEKILSEIVVTTEQAVDTNGDDDGDSLCDNAPSGRIAVIACGPSALVQSAKDACAQFNVHHLANHHHVSLDFHEEVFLY